MMRWMLLVIAACAFVSLWGMVSVYPLFFAFLVLFANFATFCILYERPKNRARLRVAEQLRQLNPNTDVAQRLAAAPITPTAEDRQLGISVVTIPSVATGIAAACLLVRGFVLRIF
jgi:hypothetical protein